MRSRCFSLARVGNARGSGSQLQRWPSVITARCVCSSPVGETSVTTNPNMFIYSAADIFILPTIYDPFSNACLEALACGLPVITTRSNGFSEIIENGVHGSTVDLANNVTGLRDAIQFWSDPARRADAKSRNTQRAAQFDISVNVARTLEILAQAAASAVSTSGKI